MGERKHHEEHGAPIKPCHLRATLEIVNVIVVGSRNELGQSGMVIAPRGDAATVFSLVEKEQVTSIPAAVPLIVNWLNDQAVEAFDLRSLKVVQNGGARLSPELRSRVRQRLGCIYQEVYGTAEGLLNLTRLGAA